MVGKPGYLTYKKRRETCALRPHILGIAKRLNQMNIEETIFPRRDIYVGGVKHTTYTYTEWALVASVLGLNFWRNFCFGLKQNALYNLWISPHKHHKDSYK